MERSRVTGIEISSWKYKTFRRRNQCDLLTRWIWGEGERGKRWWPGGTIEERRKAGAGWGGDSTGWVHEELPRASECRCPGCSLDPSSQASAGAQQIPRKHWLRANRPTGKDRWPSKANTGCSKGSEFKIKKAICLTLPTTNSVSFRECETDKLILNFFTKSLQYYNSKLYICVFTKSIDPVRDKFLNLQRGDLTNSEHLKPRTQSHLI